MFSALHFLDWVTKVTILSISKSVQF
jgi:hypothetical protein